MTLKPHEREILINYRLEQAKETIDDAKLLIDNSKFRSAINRIYYGMFYSLLALGLKYEYNTSKHSQLIGWFNKDFIHKGIIDKKYGKMINTAFIRRTKGDYETHIKFDKKTVQLMFEDMADFINTLENFIKVK